MIARRNHEVAAATAPQLCDPIGINNFPKRSDNSPSPRQDEAMSKAEILEELPNLTVKERDEIRRKLDELDDDGWDRQIEEDAKAGKLDRFAEEALDEYRAGRTTPFPPDAQSRDG
jgi:hypothetical protein